MSDLEAPEASNELLDLWINVVRLGQQIETIEQNDAIAASFFSEGKAADLALYLRPFEQEKHFQILRREYIGDLAEHLASVPYGEYSQALQDFEDRSVFLPRMTTEGCFFEIVLDPPDVEQLIREDSRFQADFLKDELSLDPDQRKVEVKFESVWKGAKGDINEKSARKLMMKNEALRHLLMQYDSLQSFDGRHVQERQNMSLAKHGYRSLLNITNMSDVQVLKFAELNALRTEPDNAVVFKSIADAKWAQVMSEARPITEMMLEKKRKPKGIMRLVRRFFSQDKKAQ